MSPFWLRDRMRAQKLFRVRIYFHRQRPPRALRPRFHATSGFFLNRRIAAWQLNFWARKVLGTFEKKALAYRLGVHPSTVSRVFRRYVHALFTSLKLLVHRPETEELKLTLPSCFKKKFSSCAVNIDFFKVFTDRPSCSLAHAQPWSSGKHHNTAKVLIGITPQGMVSFISKGW